MIPLLPNRLLEPAASTVATILPAANVAIRPKQYPFLFHAYSAQWLAIFPMIPIHALLSGTLFISWASIVATCLLAASIITIASIYLLSSPSSWDNGAACSKIYLA